MYDGAAMDAAALEEAAMRMVTVHEEPKKKYLEHAHAELSKSKNLLFLGFGFAEENLKRLELEKHCAAHARFCGRWRATTRCRDCGRTRRR